MFVHTYLSELKFRDTVLPLTECCFLICNFGRGGPNGNEVQARQILNF
jgi:hypothetical protein